MADAHITRFKKGMIPWNKGIPNTWAKNPPIMKGETNPSWKGESVSYPGLHIWVKNNYGSPDHCEHCGETKEQRYEWANLSRTYTRDKDDWMMLCVSCHRKRDNRYNRERGLYQWL